MKDQILSAYLTSFKQQFGMDGLEPTELFEQFVNYHVVSRHHPDTFDLDDVAVGGNGDLGIDGVAILVNDHLVQDNTGVDHLTKSLRRLDAQFVFLQSKTSSHFDGADIGNFLAGVRQFFGERPPSTANSRVLELHALKNHIFEQSKHMEAPPRCRLYYATTGNWVGEAYLSERVGQGIADLKSTSLFSSVEFTPIDLDALKKLYRDLHNRTTREFVFEKHTILPNVSKVQEAYIGIVPCTEYLKLLCDDAGSLNRRLFYDNVRDFQGFNLVNTEIQETLSDPQCNDRFALLNNGVTIVARELNKVGAAFRLKDYQVVNGCQTSHILYLNKSRLTDKVFLPIKLIVTSDSEVTNQIIQGTNRQTEVKREAFESLAPFQKKLEEYYLARGASTDHPLYYERRSKQYDGDDVSAERVVTLPAQISCFVSMFLNEPHSTPRYYGELLTSYRSKLFAETHSPTPYYTAAATLARVEKLFSRGVLAKTFRPFKYHLLMLFRLQSSSGPLPPLNSKAIEKYCDGLLKVIDDERDSETAFRKAQDLLTPILARSDQSRAPAQRTREFTTALFEAASLGRREAAATIDLIRGTVKWYSEAREYGFVTSESGTDFFVHHDAVRASGRRTLLDGESVLFSGLLGHKGHKIDYIEPPAGRT